MIPNNKRVRRGEIYWCDLGEAVGSEQGGCRPVIIVQNDIGNNYSTTTIVVPLTTKIKKMKLPTHHEFENNGVKQVACAEQIRTVDKLRLGSNLGFVRKEDVDEISRCVHIAVEEIEFKPKTHFKQPVKQVGKQPNGKVQQGQHMDKNVKKEDFKKGATGKKNQEGQEVLWNQEVREVKEAQKQGRENQQPFFANSEPLETKKVSSEAKENHVKKTEPTVLPEKVPEKKYEKKQYSGKKQYTKKKYEGNGPNNKNNQKNQNNKNVQQGYQGKNNKFKENDKSRNKVEM